MIYVKQVYIYIYIRDVELCEHTGGIQERVLELIKMLKKIYWEIIVRNCGELCSQKTFLMNYVAVWPGV